MDFHELCAASKQFGTIIGVPASHKISSGLMWVELYGKLIRNIQNVQLISVWVLFPSLSTRSLPLGSPLIKLSLSFQSTRSLMFIAEPPGTLPGRTGLHCPFEHPTILAVLGLIVDLDQYSIDGIALTLYNIANNILANLDFCF